MPAVLQRSLPLSQTQHLGCLFLCGHKPTRFSPNSLTATCRGGSVRRVGGTKWGKVGSVRRSVATSDVPGHLPPFGRCQGTDRHSGPLSRTVANRHGDLQGRGGLPAAVSP